MKVRIKLFGPQAQMAGRRELELALADEGPTCTSILAALAEAEPRLQPTLAASRIAINHEFAAPEAPVRPDDEIALIGMVSGG